MGSVAPTRRDDRRGGRRDTVRKHFAAGRARPLPLPGHGEASPSPVYGARLLSGFGATTPSRVQIPPPPPARPNSPPGYSAGGWRACNFCKFVQSEFVQSVSVVWIETRPSHWWNSDRDGRLDPPEKQSGEHHGQARHQVRSGCGCRGSHLGSCEHGGTGSSGRHQLGSHRDPRRHRDSLRIHPHRT